MKKNKDITLNKRLIKRTWLDYEFSLEKQLVNLNTISQALDSLYLEKLNLLGLNDTIYIFF